MTLIDSPCVLICVIEQNSGYCYGCGRTRDEIAQWSTLAVADQKRLVGELPARVATLERRPRRKTRRRQLTEQRGETA